MASATAPSVGLTPDVLASMGVASVYAGKPGSIGGAPGERATGLSFSDCGRVLVTSHAEGTLRVINGETSAVEATLFSREYGCKLITHTHHHLSVLHAATVARNGEESGQIAYQSLHDNKIIRFFRGHKLPVTSIAMAPMADTFITSARDGAFKLWDLRSPNCIASGFMDLAGDGVAAFDSSGAVFAVASPSRSVSLYDVRTLQSPARTTRPLAEFSTSPTPLAERPGWMVPPRYPAHVSWTSIDFSSDDRFIAIASADRGVLVVDAFEPAREYALCASHPIDTGAPCNAAFSADGRFLVTGGADGHVWAYDLTSNPPGLTLGKEATGTLDPVPWVPGRWEVPSVLLGERHKPPESAAAARAAAAAHGNRVHDVLRQAAAGAAAQMSVPLQAVPPPTVVPSVPADVARTEGEQVSRHEGPVRMVRWHPRLAVLASASTVTAVWAAPMPAVGASN